MPKTDLETATQGDQTGLVAAFQSVTDGVADLAKTHFELAKAEARRDVKVYSRDVRYAVVGLGIAFLGAGLINLAIVIFAGYLGGLGGAAGTAAVLGLGYALLGRRVALAALQRMKEREGALTKTKHEIKRSTEWAKEIKESS